MRNHPFSALYYVKENRGKVAITIIMFFFATLIFLGGNYIASTIDTFEPYTEFTDKLILIGYESSDTDGKDYAEFQELVKADDNLKCLYRTGRGTPSFSHKSVLGITIGNGSLAFNSVQDMEEAFRVLGIQGDLSACKNGSVVMSEMYAKAIGVELGQTLDRSFESALEGSYTVDALVDGDSYVCFYVIEDNDNLSRMYVYSDTMEGNELRDYIQNLMGDRKVHMARDFRLDLAEEMNVFLYLFYLTIVLVGIVLAVTVNSVVSGQYLKRTFEFAVYRAIGKTKGEIRRKIAGEMVVMDLLGMAAGILTSLLFTYLLNELYYRKNGLYLLYCSKLGVIGMVVCNLMILVPIIISKGRRMSKADVTEF